MTWCTLKGIDRIFSDQKPVMRGGPVDDQDDDEGFGNGEPPEIKEFIEELGESGPEFVPQSSPPLFGLPLMMLLGCLTVSTAIWKECGNLFDMILLNSPLGDVFIPKNVPSKSRECFCGCRGCCPWSAKATSIASISSGICRRSVSDTQYCQACRWHSCRESTCCISRIRCHTGSEIRRFIMQ